MRNLGRTTFSLGMLSVWLLTSPLRGQASIKLGGEFQVNVFTPQDQKFPDAAMDRDGDFVVVWDGALAGGSSDIAGRRFNSAGVGQASEFRVNSYTSGSQLYATLGVDDDGDFVVAWTSGQDGSPNGVFGRRFNSAGVAQGVDFLVNAYTPGNQFSAALALEGDGDFVVTWNSSEQDGGGFGVFGRRFNSSGAPQGAEFRVNTYTPGNQFGPAVAREADGDFVVVWHSTGQDGQSLGVFGRRFNNIGVAQAAEFQVNAYTVGSQIAAKVGFDSGGGFVVAWGSLNQDGDGYGVFARRFNSSGTAQAAELQVNSYTPGAQYNPAVSVDPDGDFVVAWQSGEQDGSGYGVFARRFSSAGLPQASEFAVNSHTTDSQYYPSVAASGNRYVIAWHSVGQDETNTGRAVIAQRFATLAVLDIDANGEVGPLTDGLLVLRFLFGFSGATLVSGAIDAVGCNRCNAPTIEAYLETLI